MKLSYVITSKYADDPKLHQLLSSIQHQVLGCEKEILVITEGTSESAKAIGIRKATGDVICILASDNEFTSPYTSMRACLALNEESVTGAFPATYELVQGDHLLNRYFALLGANDPLAYFMGKADRYPIGSSFPDIIEYKEKIPTLGDNGFFIKRDIILKANLDRYYHIDVCEDLRRLGYYRYAILHDSIWHKTGEHSVIDFLRRRARFGAQHAFNRDRRWHLVSSKDILRLCFFIIASTTMVYTTYQAVNGYLKTKDKAWFIHPIICLITVFTYGFLILHVALNVLWQSLFAHMEDLKA